MAGATLDTVTKQLEDDNAIIFRKFNRIDIKQDESIKLQTFQLKTLTAMLNLQLDDSAAAAERAREAARLGEPEEKGIPDAKADEAKAGGFFSKMGKAVMNPVGAMGRGMKSMGKGIQGFLTGLANGLAAFANPMVLVGVTVLSISLPIFAAGLAAAFKVFEMIAGQGKALEFVTGIIESLGTAIGTILQKVLEGFGNMVKNMGPFITTFFKGIATVIKALEPIVVSIFKILKDIITDPAFNKTIQEVLKLVGTALKEVSKVIQKVGDVIIAVVGNIGGIIESVGKAISGVIDSLGSGIEKVLNAIGTNIEKIGGTVATIIDSIGNNIAKVGKTIEGIIGSIGDTVSQIIDSVVSGIERLTALDPGKLLLLTPALIGLAGALMLFSAGAALAGAIMPSSKDLERMAKSVELFGQIDSSNLAPVGVGMAAIGAGLGIFGVGAKLATLLDPGKAGLESVAKNVERFGLVPSENLKPVGLGMQAIGDGLFEFGVGGKIASLLNDPKGLEAVAASVTKFGLIDATNFSMVGTGMQAIGEGLKGFGVGGFVSGLAEGFGKWIGASDPVEKFQKFAAIGPGLKDAGDGVTALAKSFESFDSDNLEKIGEGLDKFLGATDMAKLKEFSQATEGLMTGQMLAELQIQANQVRGAGTNVVVNNVNSSHVNSSTPVMLPDSGATPQNQEKQKI